MVEGNRVKKNQPLSIWNSYSLYLSFSLLVCFIYFFVLIFFFLLSFMGFEIHFLGTQLLISFIGSLVASFFAGLIFIHDLAKPHFNNELTSVWGALFPEEEIKRDFTKEPCASVLIYPLVIIFVLITLPAYYVIFKTPFKAPDAKVTPLTEPAITKTLEPLKATTVTPPESVDKEKLKLFSSIEYQVQDIILEQSAIGPLVHLVPYHGSISEITVEFPQNHVIMKGCLRSQDLQTVSFEFIIEDKPKIYSISADLWQYITLVGDEMIIEEIKLRTEMAERLVSLCPAHAIIDSPNQGEICIQVTCNETSEAIKQAYLLIIDLQSFFENKFFDRN